MSGLWRRAWGCCWGMTVRRGGGGERWCAAGGGAGAPKISASTAPSTRVFMVHHLKQGENKTFNEGLRRAGRRDRILCDRRQWVSARSDRVFETRRNHVTIISSRWRADGGVRDTWDGNGGDA